MPKFRSVQEMMNAFSYEGKADAKRKAMIAEGLGYTFMSDADTNKYNSMLERLNPNKLKNKAFKEAGLHSDAPVRQAIAFTCYLMSKKNMSFLEAIDFVPGVAGFDDTLAEFHKFLDEHPVKNLDSDTTEKNIGEWTEIFMKAADKFSEYKFPDINYMNTEEVKKHSYEFMRLAEFEINYSQEFDRLTGENRSFAEKKAGSAKKLGDARNKVEAIQNITIGLSEAYFHPQFSPDQHKVSGDRWFYRFATDRIKFGLGSGQQIGGKSIGEIREETGVKGLYSILATAIKAPVTLTNEEAKNFFIKGLTPEKEKEYIEAIRKSENTVRIEYNSSFQLSEFEGFCERLAVRATKDTIPWKDVFDAENDPAELVKIVGSDKGTEVRAALQDSFGAFLMGTTNPQIWELKNIESPTNIFKIGGKTPEELWGDKVKNLPQSDKEIYYQTMIVKEAATGVRPITAGLYFVDDKYKLTYIDKPVVSDTKTQIREFAFFKGVTNLNQKLASIRKRLASTGETGKSEFKAMLKALDKCIKATDITKDNDATFEKILDSMSELNKASKEYYKTHTGIRGMFKAHYENGKTRLGISDDLKGMLASEADKLKDLSAGLDFTLDKVNFAGSFGERKYQMFTKWKKFKTMSTLRADGRENTLQNLDDKSLKVPNDLADKYIIDAEKKADMRKLLNETYLTTSKGENLEAGLGGAFSEVAPLAKKFVYREYSKMIRRAGLTEKAPNVGELEIIFDKDKFQKTFHGQVDELIANKNFRKLAEKDPKHCLEKWAKMAKNIKKPAPEKAPEEANLAPKKVVKEENKAGRGMGGF